MKWLVVVLFKVFNVFGVIPSCGRFKREPVKKCGVLQVSARRGAHGSNTWNTDGQRDHNRPLRNNLRIRQSVPITASWWNSRGKHSFELRS